MCVFHTFYDIHNLLYLPNTLKSAEELCGMIWFGDSCSGLGCGLLCFSGCVTHQYLENKKVLMELQIFSKTCNGYGFNFLQYFTHIYLSGIRRSTFLGRVHCVIMSCLSNVICQYTNIAISHFTKLNAWNGLADWR